MKVTAVPPPRRKGAATRTWLVISDSGSSHFEEVSKRSIMRRAGLPARDLRILDPLLLYQSRILGRERAIVVNMEHIKAILTAKEVLVLNFKDPLVAQFVHDLEHRVSNSNQAGNFGVVGSHTDLEVMGKAAGFPSSGLAFDEVYQENSSPLKSPDMANETNDSSPRESMPKTSGAKVLPFEFKALEVCLESSCRRLENETSTLEQEAYPALDELTSIINTLNLQRVRHIKSRLVALHGRVQKVRDELENLLDDDMDMAEMYLTDKLINQQSDELASADEVEEDASDSNDESDHEVKSSKSENKGFKPNIEELEMLLEAYFAQIEGTLNKLSTMREYVDDTEDYINIMLDDKQNQLLRMGVLLSTANLVLNAGIVVAGIFGMNITIDIYADTADKIVPNRKKFGEATTGIVAGVAILYIIAIYCGKKGGLLG